MAVLKCKMCGGDVQVTDNTYGTCDSCGSKSTLPKAADERKVNLFNRANHYRRQNDFDKAVQAYENILNEDNADAEAHWGIVLSRYGIEYVEDRATNQRIPTCRRVQNDSILTDADYLAALEFAPDEYTKSLYEEEAKKISEIQKGILAISSKEQPYDVFICYKESTEGGSRTKDSTIAQDIYYQLANDGYRVFFAKITLEDKLGQEYEPYIFSALNSAKVMLVIGTCKEYFEAIWVKNEWSRFLALMKKDRSKLLIPCYRDMDAYDIPDELSNLQSQDMSKVGFIQDILRGVKKVLDASKAAGTAAVSPIGAEGAVPGVESLMKRGWLFLEDSNWKEADEYFDKALDIHAEYAPAYIGKLCSELKINHKDDLANQAKLLDDMQNYKKALRFADADYKAKLTGYNQTIQEYIRKHKDLYETRKKNYNCISAGNDHTVGLKTDGTVVAVGNNNYGQCDTSEWHDIIAVSAGNSYTVGLKADRTIVTVGAGANANKSNTNKLSDIIAIFAGYNDLAVISDDGNDSNKLNDSIAIYYRRYHTVELKANGTVVAVGKNTKGQCNTSEWRNIMAVSAGDYHTVGLNTNGTVVAVGWNTKGQCNTSEWRNIIAVSAGDSHTVGLKADGTVLAIGGNESGQCNIDKWSDIIAISAGDYHTVGLKADGTVVAAGTNQNAKCNTSSWRDIGPMDEKEMQRKLEEKQRKQEEIQRKLEEKRRQEEEERKQQKEKERLRQEQSKLWQKQGLCWNCGGQIGGLFTKKCKNCGRKEDEQWL